MVTKQQFLITLEIPGYHFRASFAQCEKKFLSYFVSRMSLVCSPPISLCVSFFGERGRCHMMKGGMQSHDLVISLLSAAGSPAQLRCFLNPLFWSPFHPFFPQF